MKDNCIIPKNATFDKDGYPRKKFQNRVWRLNRLMWTIVHGDIEEGLVVAHSCNNKGCINPNHFYLCTPEENSAHAARDGLYPILEKHSKFIHSIDILKVWERYCEGVSQVKLAKELGIAQSTLSTRFSRLKQHGLIEDER